MITDLLDLAEDLARRDPTRPKSASLRRAVSTAYYALFHALASLCTEQLVGWSKPWAIVTPVYRALDHGRAKLVLQALRRERRAELQLNLIVAAFQALQEGRQNADYNPEPFLNRGETLELVALAKQATGALGSLAPATKLELAIRLLVKGRGPG